MIQIAGAVLFCAATGCASGENSTNGATVVNTTAEVVKVNIADTAFSVAELVGYGYTVKLPKGYAMAFDEGDSIFRIGPDVPDSICTQHLSIEFRSRPITVPGTRPMPSIPVNILGQTVAFREFIPMGWKCTERRGQVVLESSYIHIICDAPAGPKMEEIFAIGTSLQEL